MNSGNWDTALWEPIKQHRRGMAFMWVIYSFITLNFTRYLFTKKLSVDRIYISNCTILVGMTNILPMLLNTPVLIKQGYSFANYFFYLVSSVNRTCTHAFASIMISILRDHLRDRNNKVSSVISISFLKSGFTFRFNEGFRHFIVSFCNASLLRWHPWEKSKLPVWPPSTVHRAAHLRLITKKYKACLQKLSKENLPNCRNSY